MYGKIFESIYDGTLYGQWEALVTFQQMIVLSDSEGVVDMTPPVISARTSIPLHIIEKGIGVLEKEDPYSRTPKDGGKRIKRIDKHRKWGWKIINHKYYRNLASMEDKRQKDKERMRERRAAERKNNNLQVDVAGCSDESQKSPMQDANADTNTKKTLSGKPDESVKVKEIITYLNDKASKNYKPGASKNRAVITARWNEGYREPDFERVINTKTAQWLGTEYEKYLRPETLFGPKFEGYVCEPEPKKPEKILTRAYHMDWNQEDAPI